MLTAPSVPNLRLELPTSFLLVLLDTSRLACTILLVFTLILAWFNHFWYTNPTMIGYRQTCTHQDPTTVSW